MGPKATTRKIRRSRVPCGRSSCVGFFMPIASTYIPGPYVEGQGPQRSKRESPKLLPVFLIDDSGLTNNRQCAHDRFSSAKLALQLQSDQLGTRGKSALPWAF